MKLFLQDRMLLFQFQYLVYENSMCTKPWAFKKGSHRELSGGTGSAHQTLPCFTHHFWGRFQQNWAREEKFIHFHNKTYPMFLLMSISEDSSRYWWKTPSGSPSAPRLECFQRLWSLRNQLHACSRFFCKHFLLQGHSSQILQDWSILGYSKSTTDQV